MQWSLDDDKLEGSDIGTLSLTDTFLLPGGSDNLYVIGSDGESKYHLVIPFTAAKPEFTLATVPMTLWAMPGGDATVFELELGAEYGWDDPVTLSINSDYLPYGISAGLATTPAGATANSITVTPPTSVYLRVMAQAGAAEDLYVLHVDATATGQTEVVEPRLLVATSCNMADLSVTVTDSPDPVMTGGERNLCAERDQQRTVLLCCTHADRCASGRRDLRLRNRLHGERLHDRFTGGGRERHAEHGRQDAVHRHGRAEHDVQPVHRDGRHLDRQRQRDRSHTAQQRAGCGRDRP